jgi:hypothetical protein
MVVPTTYADARIQTERLGELHQCLMAHGFAMWWTEGKVAGREYGYWAIRHVDEHHDKSVTQ